MLFPPPPVGSFLVKHGLVFFPHHNYPRSSRSSRFIARVIARPPAPSDPRWRLRYPAAKASTVRAPGRSVHAGSARVHSWAGFAGFGRVWLGGVGFGRSGSWSGGFGRCGSRRGRFRGSAFWGGGFGGSRFPLAGFWTARPATPPRARSTAPTRATLAGLSGAWLAWIIRFLRPSARVEAQFSHLWVHGVPKVGILTCCVILRVTLPLWKVGKMLQMDVGALRISPARGKRWVGPEVPA